MLKKRVPKLVIFKPVCDLHKLLPISLRKWGIQKIENFLFFCANTSLRNELRSKLRSKLSKLHPGLKDNLVSKYTISAMSTSVNDVRNLCRDPKTGKWRRPINGADLVFPGHYFNSFSFFKICMPISY